MARPHSSRRGIFQGDAEYQGVRKRRNFRSLKEATIWETSVAFANDNNLPLPDDKAGDGESFTFGGFVKKHFNFLWGSNSSSGDTLKTIKLIYKIIPPDTPIMSIDYECLVDFTSKLKDNGNSNATINRKMAVLSKTLRHAANLELISSIPTIPRHKESVGRIRFYTKLEEERIVNRFDHLGLTEDKHMVRFLLYTGFRWSEAERAERRDVDERSKHLSVWETKADQPRTIPITEPVREAMDYLTNKYPDSRYFFNMKYITFNGHWDRVRCDLGFGDDPHFTIHTLRHTCASRLVQAGVDLRRVQTWMGHKAIATTLRYAHLSPTDLDIAAKALVT